MIFRSRKVLDHARGQPCCLRFIGCDGGGETTVACHIRDAHKGTGIKASDHSIVFGCAHCHRLLDEGFMQIDPAEMHFHIARGLVETWGILIRDGIIGWPHDIAKPISKKPRKPKEQRPKMRNKGFDKTRTRRMDGTVRTKI